MWLCRRRCAGLTKPDNVVTITINQGDTLEDVARISRITASSTISSCSSSMGNSATRREKIGTGTFELNQQFDYHALVYGLASSSESRKTVTLTFPEGYTCDQII